MVGAPFFSDPYFGFAMMKSSRWGLPFPLEPVSGCAVKTWLNSPRMAPRFLPVVIIPQPPIE